jgi:hypothetical protein
MKRIVAVIFGLIMLAGLGVMPSVADDSEEAEDMLCIPLATISLEAPEGVAPKRSPVDFPHSVHFNYKCQDCHHKWDGQTEFISCTTSGCHDLTQTPKKDTKASKTESEPSTSLEKHRYYKTAFHTLCIGCHKKIKQENQSTENKIVAKLEEKVAATGPTSCNKCHPKE